MQRYSSTCACPCTRIRSFLVSIIDTSEKTCAAPPSNFVHQRVLCTTCVLRQLSSCRVFPSHALQRHRRLQRLKSCRCGVRNLLLRFVRSSFLWFCSYLIFALSRCTPQLVLRTRGTLSARQCAPEGSSQHIARQHVSVEQNRAKQHALGAAFACCRLRPV